MKINKDFELKERTLFDLLATAIFSDTDITFSGSDVIDPYNVDIDPYQTPGGEDE